MRDDISATVARPSNLDPVPGPPSPRQAPELDAPSPRSAGQIPAVDASDGALTRQRDLAPEKKIPLNEQDMKRNWLYEFYRRQWNSTTMSFPLKETGRL